MPPSIDYEKLKSVTQEQGERLTREPSKAIIEKRVETRLIENYLKEAKVKTFTFLCDEPIESGGSGKAPQALDYFLAGAAFCELSILTRYAALLGVKIDDLQVIAKAKLDRRVHWTRIGLGQIIPGFSEIVFEVRIKSPEPPERIKELVMEVEGRCPAYNTLRRPVPVRDEVYLNGEPLKLEPSQIRSA